MPSLSEHAHLKHTSKKLAPIDHNSKMSIFNLKTNEQQQQQQQLKPIHLETTELTTEAVDETDVPQDNLSFCSEDTNEFVRDANDYFLEDDNRVTNEKLYMSETKYHRSFQIVPNSRLPSLVNKPINENEIPENEQGLVHLLKHSNYFLFLFFFVYFKGN